MPNARRLGAPSRIQTFVRENRRNPAASRSSCRVNGVGSGAVALGFAQLAFTIGVRPAHFVESRAANRRPCGRDSGGLSQARHSRPGRNVDATTGTERGLRGCTRLLFGSRRQEGRSHRSGLETIESAGRKRRSGVRWSSRRSCARGRAFMSPTTAFVPSPDRRIPREQARRRALPARSGGPRRACAPAAVRLRRWRSAHRRSDP
jgi:hypothetical protein